MFFKNGILKNKREPDENAIATHGLKKESSRLSLERPRPNRHIPTANGALRVRARAGCSGSATLERCGPMAQVQGMGAARPNRWESGAKESTPSFSLASHAARDAKSHENETNICIGCNV